MPTIQESEFVSVSPENIREDGRPVDDQEGSHIKKGVSPQRGWNTGVDLVLPVSDPINIKPALEHSIKLAKTYGARIVLMYVTNPKAIPNGYLEYAKAERIQDYHSAYFGSIADAAMTHLKRRIEEEGVECTSYSCVGSLRDAIKTCQQTTRVLMLVLPLPAKSLRPRFRTSGFKLSMLSGLSVPVFLVPM